MKALGIIVTVLCGAVLIFITIRVSATGATPTPRPPAMCPPIISSIPSPTRRCPTSSPPCLADYRGYDTMFETTVIFAAGIACLFLLKISMSMT